MSRIVSAQVPEPMFQALETARTAAGHSMSSMVRLALAEWLARQPNGPAIRVVVGNSPLRSNRRTHTPQPKLPKPTNAPTSAAEAFFGGQAEMIAKGRQVTQKLVEEGGRTRLVDGE